MAFNLLSVVPINGFNNLLTAFANVKVTISNKRPDVANIGDIWYDPITNERWIYTTGGWVIDDTLTNTTEPTDPDLGEYWFNNGVLYQWDGTQWVAVGGVLRATSTNLIVKYGQYFNTTTNIKFNYSQFPIVKSTLSLRYDQPFIVLKDIVFPYREAARGVALTTQFIYTIQNNRLRFGLNKGIEINYSLSNPVPVLAAAQFNYSAMQVITNTLVTKYADTQKIKTVTAFPYSPLQVITNTLVTKYADTIKLNKVLLSGWVHKAPVALSTSFNYDISNKQYVFLEGKFGYSIQNLSVQTINASPTLLKNGVPIDFIVITLSADEGSPYWLGAVSLANVEDFSLFNVEDSVQVVFNDLTFNLIVDGKDLSRGDNAEQTCKLSLISPSAILDNPFAESVSKSYATPTSAKAVVEEMLGAITWDLPDWIVPVEELQFSNTSPLSIARELVQAIGGVIETTPEGSIICRRTYPVDVTAYSSSDAISVPDTELFSITETIAPQKIVNNLDLYTQDLDSIRDTLEYVAEDGTQTAGVIYAYPKPVRSVNLIHTGSPDVVINPQSVDTRLETETIEFISGKAATRYPIDSIVSMQWKYTNLGAISFKQNEIQSTIAGESLLLISYRVTSYKFDVRGKELTQFCLQD